jgi:hypothetical protein
VSVVLGMYSRVSVINSEHYLQHILKRCFQGCNAVKTGTSPPKFVACFLPISCLAYSRTLKMEAMHSPYPSRFAFILDLSLYFRPFVALVPKFRNFNYTGTKYQCYILSPRVGPFQHFRNLKVWASGGGGV